MFVPNFSMEGYGECLLTRKQSLRILFHELFPDPKSYFPYSH